MKARYSRKYFGRGKGVVAYTLLCNHVPLNGYLIGAHEYEAHHVFDIWYRNTSDIVPSAITGDMHSINKANFAILHWFGLRFEPRFTDLDDQLQELYCADDLALYEKCLIRPAGQIDRQLIVGEKANIDRSMFAFSPTMSCRSIWPAGRIRHFSYNARSSAQYSSCNWSSRSVKRGSKRSPNQCRMAKLALLMLCMSPVIALGTMSDVLRYQMSNTW